MWGKIPSSIPTRKTAGNSSPLAMCMVISETVVPSPSSWSESATSDGGLQELGQRAVLVGHADQLVHVLHPPEGLDGPFGQELAAVAGALDHGGDQLAGAEQRRRRPGSSATGVSGQRGGPGATASPLGVDQVGNGHVGAQFGQQVGQVLECLARLAADPGLAGLGHRIAEGQPALAGEARQLGHRRGPPRRASAR